MLDQVEKIMMDQMIILKSILEHFRRDKDSQQMKDSIGNEMQ